MNKVMSVCMDNFPTFQWKINVHDDECYETTVSGSFGPFNTVDVFTEGNKHVVVSEFGAEGKWDQECDDVQLQQTLEDLSQAFNYEQSLTSRPIPGEHSPILTCNYDIFLDNFGGVNQKSDLPINPAVRVILDSFEVKL